MAAVAVAAARPGARVRAGTVLGADVQLQPIPAGLVAADGGASAGEAAIVLRDGAAVLEE
jgi:hypothetical protein